MFLHNLEGEKPLDRLAEDGGFSGIFRRIVCIGDSLSSGEFEAIAEDGTTTYHDFYEYSWGQYMARTIGATVYNFSRGGMTARDYHAFADEKGYWAPEYACQAYIVALGVNDLHWRYGGDTLGSLEDLVPDHPEQNRETFAGCYGGILQKIRLQQPEAKIFLMTIPRECTETAEDAAGREEHAQLLYQMAEHFPNTYVMDFRRYAPSYDEEFRCRYYLGEHMNPAGYLLTGKYVMSYLDYLIRHNPSEFAQVGLIGTGLHR